MTTLVISTWLACTGSEVADPAQADAVEGPEARPKLAIGDAAPAPRPATATPAPDEPVDPTAPITEAMCDDLEDGGTVAGPDCITGTVACGGTVIGHTRGGTTSFDTKFYEHHFCTPATTDHDGGDERVYLLQIPEGDHRAVVTLHTPCADLDLAAVKVRDTETCPTFSTGIRQCEMSVKKSKKPERVELASRDGANWLLVVEGKGEAEGAFALTVSCEDHL